MNWNSDQQDAIRASGNVIVSAAAGAGKTSVLTERVFRLVQAGTPIERMLILTFTRAAASEMKTRIAARLESAANDAETDAERAYLRTQAQLCDSANISTIHAFCAKVVFRHFFRVGLAPSAKTMDETESAVLRKEVRERVLTALAAEHPEQYRLLIGGFNGEAALIDVLGRLYDFLSAEPDPDAWLSRTEATLCDRAAFDILLSEELKRDQNELALALDTLLHARDALLPAAQKAIALSDDLLMHGRGALLQTERVSYGKALAGMPIAGRLSFPKDFPASDAAPIKDAKAALVKCVKLQAERYAEDADALFATQAAGAQLIFPLFDLLRDFRAAYTEEKKQRAVVDFNDLEHLTIEILRDDRIAAEYRERFVHVIVDEYQDSNRVQEAILSRMTRGDNLFFVGDVKQSIYRFRKAEPQLFLEKCRAFTGSRGTRIDLKQNFRSSEAVISAVNRVFETVMQEPIAGIAYDAAARLYRGSRETGGIVECHLLEKRTGTDEESLADADAEARFIAASILDRMRRPLYDAGCDAMRMPTYGDFAILLRSKSHADVFAETLAFAGIPCFAQMSGGYFEAIEVQLVWNLLRVLDNRRQDIPLLSVLRSPFFRFTDAELIALRMKQRKGDLLDCLLNAQEENEHVRKTLAQIDAWRTLSRRVTMEELLDTICDAVQLKERMGALPGGMQRVRNLDALTERARAFDVSGSGGIHSFLRFLDDAAEASELGASQTVTANVVRIMTIHKSKGLEFPIVYLANLGKQFNRKDETDSLLLHETYGVGLQFLDELGYKRRTYARNLIRGAIADAAWQEELRVLYVGMTRAKSELCLVGCVSKAEEAIGTLPEPTLSNLRNANNAMRLLLLSLNGYLPLQVHRKSEFLPEEQRAVLPSLPAADPKDVDRLSAQLLWEYPFPRPVDLPTKTSVTALGEKGLSPFTEPIFSDVPDAAALGTQTHAILERLPLRPVSDAELFAAAEALGGVPKGHFDAVRWFLHSSLYARMLASKRAEREWSFVRPVPANRLLDTAEETPVLLQGVIDACFTENGGWVLLDYKTDHVNGDPTVHAERHRKQITLYAESLEALTRLPVHEAYVVLLNARAAVRLL